MTWKTGSMGVDEESIRQGKDLTRAATDSMQIMGMSEVLRGDQDIAVENGCTFRHEGSLAVFYCPAVGRAKK